MKETIKKIINEFKKIITSLKEKIKKYALKTSTFFKNIFFKLSTKLHLVEFFEKIGLNFLYKKFKKVDKNIYKKIFILIFFPILIYLYAQFFCNGKLIFEAPRMLLNFIFIYFIFFTLQKINKKIIVA